MQEQVNEKTIALSVKTAKFTGRVFEKAVLQLFRHMKKQQKSRDSPVTHKGRQTVKQLVGQGAEINTTEIDDKSIKSFRQTARKYGVDFAITKSSNTEVPKWTIFFKSRDSKAMESAIGEYSAKLLKEKKPSVLSTLKKNLESIRNAVVDRSKNKHKDLER